MASNILTDAEIAKIRERVSVAFVTGEPSACNPPQYYGPSQGEYIRVLDSHAALAKQAAEAIALLRRFEAAECTSQDCRTYGCERCKIADEVEQFLTLLAAPAAKGDEAK